MSEEREYDLTVGCRGYASKPDPTNLDNEFLVAGSQNMVINDQERVETRAGYELFGVASATTNVPKSSFVWKNSGANEIFLREINGTLQWYSETSEAWETLLTGLSATKVVRFAPFWNNTEVLDTLMFVNNSSILYEWTGGMGTYASSTPTTVVINETIASKHFFATGSTAKVRVKDSGGTWREFTVTSHTGSTFTVSEDPTAFTFTANALVVQSVRSNSNTPASGFTNDFIDVFQNQLFVGSETSQQIRVSRNSDNSGAVPLFTSSSPRVAGEGATITLDASCVGFKVPGLRETETESKMIIFCERDRAYSATFEISPGSSADREVVRTKPLPLGPGQGARSQELIERVKKTVVWVSNDNELLDLASIEQEAFKVSAISDPIKPDFTDATFTNGEVKFWRSNIVITAPNDGKVWIFDTSKGFWNPPQIMGMRRLEVYVGDLYGHSNAVSETYKLFTGKNDNTNPISFKAHFAYRNKGRRDALKNFNRYFTEFYIQSNTKVTCSLLYDWKGSRGIISYILDGSSQQFLFTPVADASLGVNPLGTNPLGGLLEAGEDTPKYRRFRPVKETDYFEYQSRFESESDDAVFQILAHGGNVKLSANKPSRITL